MKVRVIELGITIGSLSIIRERKGNSLKVTHIHPKYRKLEQSLIEAVGFPRPQMDEGNYYFFQVKAFTSLPKYPSFRGLTAFLRYVTFDW
ncbi:hypothetical protein HP439_15005 [Sphingobacterium shayense]|uniref:hypothetical protein n=1 Tax=Sphingobacterium shayense TaxID=626343 RepID=UPI0015564D3A|nr:hypothetical protein [Sphingobacterium shayense]NQD72033.1 hypothetical protein [Sphingobacterium shayense]